MPEWANRYPDLYRITRFDIRLNKKIDINITKSNYKKWHLGYMTVTWLVTSRDQKGQGHGINMPGDDYLENGWRHAQLWLHVTLNVKVVQIYMNANIFKSVGDGIGQTLCSGSSETLLRVTCGSGVMKCSIVCSTSRIMLWPTTSFPCQTHIHRTSQTTGTLVTQHSSVDKQTLGANIGKNGQLVYAVIETLY